MSLLHESSVLGVAVRVYSDRVEYKRGLGSGVESIPIAQIASVRLGNWLVNRLWIETAGGHVYAITTRRKQEVADAIQIARSAPGEGPLVQGSDRSNVSVADELGKLAGLRAQGILSNDEFERQKSALLSSPAARIGAATPSARVTLPPQSPPRTFLRKVRLVVLVVAGLFVFLVIVAVAVGPSKREQKPADASSSSSSSSPSSVEPSHSEKDLLSAAEKGYFGPTIDYLNAINGADTRLAKVMVGAQDGTSNLSDIKDAIETAQASEDGNFRDYERADVPASLRDLDQEIRRCKRKHDAAFAEMLAFWTDNNTVHVERGTDELRQAVQVTNQCIADTGAAMTRLSDQRRTGAPPIATAPMPPVKRSRPPAKKTAPPVQTTSTPPAKSGGEIDLGSEPAEAPASCKDKVSDPKNSSCVKQFCAAHAEDARCSVE